MNYLLLFLLFSQFLLLSLITFTNGSQFMVEIEPDWKPLPEYHSLLEPEQFREVFQSKRFELQIFKEGVQEGISIAGSRFMMLKERDVFLFENIPEDWMEPNRVVLEIKLPPILMVKKLLLSEESFYQPRIRRKFHILRNQNTQMTYRNKSTLMIYKFSILENPKRIFRPEDLLPPMEAPTGRNEVAYMESLNNSVTKLEQSEQLCAQTKYECNLNLLLKYTHVERQFDAFLRAVSKRTLTVSAQNFATIKAKSDKFFTDIMKLAVEVLEDEKKIFKENASSSIDLHYSSPAVPILQLHSQHHALNTPYSSQATSTSGTRSSVAGVLPMNRKIIFELMPIGEIAQILSGLHPARISQPSQINIIPGTNQERMKFIISDFLSPNSLNPMQSAHLPVGQQQQQQQQREFGQTSRLAGQTKERGKEKVSNVVQPTANVEEISSSQENDPNPMSRANVQVQVTDRPADDNQNKKGQKRKHSYENVPVAGDENRIKHPNQHAAYDNHQWAALWRHLVRFEDVLLSDSADVDRQKEEEEERSKLADSIKLTLRQIYHWIYNTNTRLKSREVTRWEFENWKKKYQSEMAATAGGDKDKASASGATAPKVPPAAANKKQQTDSDENKHGFNHDQKLLLWKHMVKFEDVWVTDHANLDRRIEEQRERFNLENLLRFTNDKVYKWFHNTKTRMKTSEKLRREFEFWKKKYQSEMAATAGGDNATAIANASKVPPADANEKTSNVEVISSSEETDPNPLAIVPYEPILNDPIDARPLNWLPPAGDNQSEIGQKRKHSSENVPVAGDEKRFRLHGYVFDDRQREALWRHFVKFEDVLFTPSADVDVDRLKEEEEERSKLADSIKLTLMQIYQWIYNINRKLSRNSIIIREQFDSEKKKYQSEMAAKIAEYKASASANAPKISSPTAVNSEMAARIAGVGKDKASGSASAPAEVSPASANLNLEESIADEEDNMEDNDVN